VTLEQAFAGVNYRKEGISWSPYLNSDYLEAIAAGVIEGVSLF